MQVNSILRFRSRFTLSFFGVALIVGLMIVPSYFRSGAQSTRLARGLKTVPNEPDLPNYDIRDDKKAAATIAQFRSGVNKAASDIADLRDQIAAGERQLASQVPTLRVEYNHVGIPEIISPDVKQGKAALTAATSLKHSDTLLNFVRGNGRLMGVASAQVDDQLKVFSDYTNPNGDLSFVEIDQEINGIPVFQGEVKAGFNRKGEMFRVINNLAPAIDGSSVSQNFGDPAAAVSASTGHVNLDPAKLDLRFNQAESTDLKATFGVGDWATTAEKMYFPTEPGVAVPAWRVLIWEPDRAYYVLVDAQSGTLLWRKNITQDQTQAATYSVYANPNAMINAAHNPFPLVPSPLSPNGAQGASIGRTLVTKIGNEAPNTFNNLGWIPDGVTKTDGNNVQAGIDRDGLDGVDPNGEAIDAGRNFTYFYNPLDPNTNTGDAPVPNGPQTFPTTPFQQGTTTQLFYYCNLYHDQLYLLGFTEAARNFQNDNFGRGGAAGDRVRAESQDSSGTNNANFATPADGTRGRMQMFIFTGPNPDIDGSLDGDVVLHEHTHGLSNRLHGNGVGLSTNMAGGMGEGWSDFYAMALLSTPNDPLNGITPAGAYATYLFGGGTNNNFYGIRRFPYALISSVGTNLKPYNPLTFNDVDSAKINLSDGAFPRNPVIGGNADEVHNMGEVWCSTLWEVRGRFIQRLEWAEGNRRVLQLVTDGMKLAPLAPTFLSERDAIIAAAQNEPNPADAAADTADIWAGFAARGMGASATIQNIGGGGNDTRVTEAFDLPNLDQTPDITVVETPGAANSNGNGFFEPNEKLTITVPLRNFTGQTATGVTLQVVGGGSANYGTINNGVTGSQQVTFTVPSNTPCGSLLTLTFNVNSSLGPTSFTRALVIGTPSFTENFDGVAAPAIPAGWTATSVLGGLNYTTVTTSFDTLPNSVFAPDPVVLPGAGEADLISPSVPISSAAAIVSFRHKFNSEAAFDGGVLEIKIGGGAFTDILTAGGAFISNGYNGTMTPENPTPDYTPNPLNGRAGWTGNSSGYITTVVQLPATANGQNIRLRWRFGADDNTAGPGPNPGWNVDTIRVFGPGTCPFVPPPVKSRADFDGDGKTDLTVYRPDGGNWFSLKSGGGILVQQWGIPGDIVTPGDFDGDGKADQAVFRPSQGLWLVLKSSDSTVRVTEWGVATDIPVAADYDGDGKTDIAVYRSGLWFVLGSTSGVRVTEWGVATDIPVPGDYDGDGKTDIAIYRSGLWFVLGSTSGVRVTEWGIPTDIPVPGDYDGDGHDDLAIYRSGLWFVLGSTGGVRVTEWGIPTDIPVPGDYDGDGHDDLAIYRSGLWFVIGSTSGVHITEWGVATDIPIPPKTAP